MQPSYIASMYNKIPKYILRIELFKCEETLRDIRTSNISKLQYFIYDESDNVLYKTTQLVGQIGAELNQRNEELCNMDINR